MRTRLAIPSAMTDGEAITLEELARGARVLEVGALLGHGTVTMAQVAEHVVSVDPHEGYPRHNPRPTLQPFLDNLERYGVRKVVVPMIGYDFEVLPHLADNSFDLAFLDLTGEYTDTYHCIIRVRRLLRDGGTLAVHDCGHPEWPGVAEACEDLLGEPLFQVDTLRVYQVYS